MEYKELITCFDSNLEILKKYDYGVSAVFKVERKNNLYILKVGELDQNIQKYGIENETRILLKAKDVQGITKLVEQYEIKQNHIAILKEYAPGKTVEDFPYKIGSPRLTDQIIETIRELHGLGIAGLDIRKLNIVVSPDFSKATMIDIGFARIRERFDKGRFALDKHVDLMGLKDIFCSEKDFEEDKYI
ncbi:MAG: serine/threonine-protein kinase [Nanoarchaeota archaeon]|nr:serine/threonine-protein kinase [Nanoarchaeota archaeon]MBU1030919.1 serine/threonine-protein kinase [Nanoarchaeota archaeon]MBU1850259.1 serine/threonine-protein kinase [Nanoarchaeota archaeon]